MNILLIGANGNAGRRIVNKALAAGHQVTGVVRREGAIEGIPTIVKDALALTKEELTQFDVVVNATSAFAPETYHLQTDLTLLLVKALANTKTRLIVVGGAGSLYVDEDHTVQLYDTPEFPEEYLGLAKAQGNAIDILRRFSTVDWTFFSPAAKFDAEGPETSDYTLGAENFIVNNKGQSYISYDTYASILVDEIKNHAFGRQRFTAVQNG
ncbi:NAD(P)-dependent oxidoreductase [Veillonella agrestimuris]|uniref:NAD(P)-dependent oxidoreductase n=1 Tax=Veillonella agrestimuris TaxID=2941340 RepID=UPI00203B7A8B|nr:NAD(P)H-binding protein [Veillonella agrestimuris]